MEVFEQIALIQSKQREAETYKKHLRETFAVTSPENLTDEMFRDVHLQLTVMGVAPTTIATQIEALIKLVFNIDRADDRISGDGKTQSGRQLEIKTSSNYKNDGHFYLKRIRMFHSLTDYILHFFNGNNGKCRWFFIPAPTLYAIGESYAMFNASTTGTRETNKDNKYVESQMEFSLNTPGHKSIKVWQELQLYRVTLQDLSVKLKEPPSVCLHTHIPTADIANFLEKG